MALPRRPAAHGRKPLRALPAARPPRHGRPLTALTQLDASRDEGRLRLRPRDRRRPLPPRLRRTPRQRTSRDGHRLRRARPHLLRRPRHPGETVDDRQRLRVRQEPLTPRTARPPRHPPPHHPALPAPHQRQSRTLPPNDGARMGTRTQLPHLSTPRRRPATLAQPLQPDTTTQLTQRPGHPSAAFTTSVGRTPSAR